MKQRAAQHTAGIIAFLVVLLICAPAVASAQTARSMVAREQALIYLVALEDDGRSGIPIGCNDSLIPVTVEIPSASTTSARIQAALERLFAIEEQFYGRSGLYNALYQSDLTVDRVEMQDNVAAVYLTGSVRVGGVCDDPRVEGQIRQTAMQFPGVADTVIVYNGGPLFSPAGSITFPQTGQTVAAPFFPYWQMQGGLPVFGYPLTGQRVEGGLRVQYLERQRFEHHPENAVPYDVLFGLIGQQHAERNGLLGTLPFQRQPNQRDPSCEYVAVTGHHLCTAFRAYWHAHGLDFGDPGISYRESLALFGYPISEEFRMTLEDGKEYTVQYFERVRMEWHPENNPPYDVLLGRFGAALLTAEER